MSQSPAPAPEPRLFKGRAKVYPQSVHGTFRRLKWTILTVALAVYYLLPWLRWDRGPFAPKQFLLIDLAHRRFYLGPIEIWPQEFYYVAGLLVMAGIGLFLITSTVGRAWCGYACPQTVWTDLFMAVERVIEGDRNARMKLDRAPWGSEKIFKRLAVHLSWLIIAVATGGFFILYFADAPTLVKNLFTGDAPSVAYATVAVLTATTYVFGGLLREQVCTYMCPWPRIQSAMLDENSLIVTYKAWRGEPRTRGVKKAAQDGGKTGDCVDCNACVAVCPTGIDIRNGPQIGCITCALCIDACNDIMGKLGRPRGLIDYTTEKRDRQEAAGEALPPKWKSVVRPRTFVYTGVWALIGLAMLASLLTRERLDLSISRQRNPLYVQLSDGSVRNGYTLKLLNMEARPRTFTLTLEGLPGAVMWDSHATESMAAPALRITVGPDQTEARQIYVRAAPASLPEGTADIRFIARAEGGAVAMQETRFDGPER
ncbi:cytochrome c oxidase accessory protein CcoG [Pedomonas mirosovicensis]|uniref:cytochrome c oxidase accessory protein CcoG n=1 Tax=Pedomonas mirosovicensis TaxID=2908641 RepID=UPI002167A71D|nr:cytochrome c oxidase accessory protein CcoG [Pedomonas mirosovicensis]MCH8686244.1 cytochrome c oxidase accessory protein CcoG [Pedomonas mirosovicensis]